MNPFGQGLKQLKFVVFIKNLHLKIMLSCVETFENESLLYYSGQQEWSQAYDNALTLFTLYVCMCK